MLKFAKISTRLYSIVAVCVAGGIFLDKYLETLSVVNLSYTMVANDLVLYSLPLSEHIVTGFKAKLDLEVHRR